MSSHSIGPLPNAFGHTEDRFYDDSCATLAKPLVELEMTRLSANIRSKPFWWTKFSDPHILASWRAEALRQTVLMKESHVNYVLAELDGYAKLRDQTSGAEVACYDRIWKSDTLVPSELKARLIAGASKLENVPDAQKDWHPRSRGKVLDLVHPSLYPVVYNRTLAYREGDEDKDAKTLEPVPPQQPPSANRRTLFSGPQSIYHVSRNYQWLPTDFVVSDDGRSVKSISYINNLYPDEQAVLHKSIEGLIGAYLPIFERVLTDSIPVNKAVPARTENSYSYDTSPDPKPDYRQHTAHEYRKLRRAWQKNRPIRVPAVPEEGYALGSLEKREISYSLAGRTIQVIVKLANIHLTPEKPKYGGGSWHIEGMTNESIAVSGIYYYDEENITTSILAFRTAAVIPHSYEQEDDDGCRRTWGIGRNDPCVNRLGAVVTQQDRAIAFPNLYQHCVSPFELQDETKPGHRKIVALFLVDPAVKIPSTTTIPPQQEEWLFITLSKIFNADVAQVIMDHVGKLGEWTMGLEEAKRHRLALMGERKAFVAQNDKRFFQVAFDLCEH